MPIKVMPYDPEWPRRFEHERELLERVLSPWLAGGVHHIGSTAIPGLAAKPILDMMAGVANLAAAEAAIAALGEHSYGHGQHRPRTLWFFKPASAARLDCTHALHLTEPGSDLWQERLTFRDALRADDALRGEYQALKLRLAAANGDDLSTYTAQKRDFVGRVLADAGVKLTDWSSATRSDGDADEAGPAITLNRAN
jgi:GrpB-like predicted nucleotidyltransferase (UPF0157 family)